MAYRGPSRDIQRQVAANSTPSIDVKNRRDRIDAIDGALGELSPFHDAFGFYVHGVSIEAAILPSGWESRVVEVRNENTNACGDCRYRRIASGA